MPLLSSNYYISFSWEQHKIEKEKPASENKRTPLPIPSKPNKNYLILENIKRTFGMFTFSFYPVFFFPPPKNNTGNKVIAFFSSPA